MGALGLRFTDGTTTVTLSNGTTGILNSYRQGSVGEDEPESTDRASVVLLSSLSTIQATVGSLNKLFRQARNYQKTGVGARVFVERDLGDSVWWRSEVLDALPVAVDSTLDIGIATGKMELDIIFTRRNYWEGAEAQIPLTNTNGTDDTSGLTVYSIDDGQAGKDNFVDIDGVNDVTGDLRTPMKLEFKNTYNDADLTEKIFLSLNIQSHNSGGTWLQHILEGEDFSPGMTVKPASPNYSLYSDGEYGELAVAATDSTSSINLDSTFLKKCGGRFFRVMAKFKATPSADTWLYLDVYDAGTRVLAYTDWVLLSTTTDILFQELGVLEIPVYKLDTSLTLDTVSLRLHSKCPSGATTLDVDYLQLFPLDGWLVFYPNLVYNCYLIHSPYDVQSYRKDTSSEILPESIWAGSNIMLEPGVNQRVYIVAYGDHMPLRTSTVKAWYRPRRLVL